MQKTLQNNFQPILVVGFWLLSMALVFYLSATYVTHKIDLNFALSNWDAGWYGNIATNGYSKELHAQSNVAFFPLFPILMAMFGAFIKNIYFAGAAVSVLAFATAEVLLYKFISKKFTPETALISIALIAFWPFSFFFAVPYTESLFLLLAVLAYTCAQNRNWELAALAAAAASATRLAGLFVALAVILGYLRTSWPKPNWLRAVLFSIIGVSGLVLFMLFLYLHTGDALAFKHIQAYWPGRENGLMGFKNTYDQLRQPILTPFFALTLIEVASLLLFLGLTVFVARTEPEWALYCLLTLITPLTTGSTTSINRYVLVLFPCYIVLARIFTTLKLGILPILPLIVVWAYYSLLFFTTKVFVG
jgi:hypothetical protein